MIQELRILEILDNDNVTLFDKGAHYVIPLYQRAYAWEDKEIVQLIDDINDTTGGLLHRFAHSGQDQGARRAV